jgi:hypothetical protein
MVGGTVIEVVEVGERIWLNIRDKTYPKDTCTIYVERNADSELIRPGDSIWWQSCFAYWTPAARDRADVKILRTGFSGVARPDGHDVFDHEEIVL